MPFWCDMRFEKGGKKLDKRHFRTRVNHIKNDYGKRFTIYATGAVVTRSSFVVLTTPNHTLVGGVSVNSLCQQGRLIALNVNKVNKELGVGEKNRFSDASRFSLQRFRIDSELVFWAWILHCTEFALWDTCTFLDSVCFHRPCFTLDMLSFRHLECSTIRCTKLAHWQTFTCALCLFILKLDCGCG